MSVSGASPQLHVSRRARLSAVTALGAVGVAVAATGYLHAMAGPEVDPVSHTVSSYVHAVGGPEVFAVAAVSLAAGAVALFFGLATAGVPLDRGTRGLAGVWCASLLLVAVFPSDVPGTEVTVTGAIHNWAGGSVFLCLPAAAWRMSSALTGAWEVVAGVIRFFAAGAGVALAGFVLTHPGVIRWYGLSTPWHGLGERILLGFQVGMLVTLAARLWRVASRPQGAVG